MLTGMKNTSCDVCARHGRQSALQLCQLNFDQAIYICPHPECTYPLDESLLESVIVQHKPSVSKVKNSKKRRHLSTADGCTGHEPAIKNIKSEPAFGTNQAITPDITPDITPYNSQFGTNNGLVDKPGTNGEVAPDVAANGQEKVLLNGDVSTPVPVESTTVSPSLVDSSSQSSSSTLPTSVNNSLLTPQTSVAASHSGDHILPRTSSSASSVSGRNHVAPANSSVSSHQSNSLTDALFLLWPNENALCWLDVVMALIVHCEPLSSLPLATDSPVRRLCATFESSQAMFRRSCKLKRCHYLCDQGKKVTLETSVGQITVKMGGGNSDICGMLGLESAATINIDDITGILCEDEPGTTSLDKVREEANRLQAMAEQHLAEIRHELFDILCPIIDCKLGQTDSALLALSALLTLEPPLSEAVSVSYQYTLRCTHCGLLQQDRVCKEVPTFLKLPADFNMTRPSFLRPCFQCMASDQTVRCTLDRLPDVFFCHFLHGIGPVQTVTDYEFVSADSRQFVVTGLVQYRTSPRHFVCHLRQLNGTHTLCSL